MTHPLQVSGPSAIDAARNAYKATSGGGDAFVTTGAAQTHPGGYCGSTPGGPEQCTDAYIVKTSFSGVPVFATFLGGPTATVVPQWRWMQPGMSM